MQTFNYAVVFTFRRSSKSFELMTGQLLADSKEDAEEKLLEDYDDGTDCVVLAYDVW